MSHRRRHGFEKVQVQAATVAALACVYFLLWPRIRPQEVEAPLACLPQGAYATLAIVAATVCGLAVLGALLTLPVRPEGALVMALLGAGGLSLRTPGIRALLWAQSDAIGGLFGMLLLEMAAMAAVLIVASAIVAGVRAIVAAWRPGWIWDDPLAKLGEDDRAMVGPRESERKPGGLTKELWVLLAVRSCRRAGRRTGGKQAAITSLSCLGLGLLLSTVLVVILMRSAERGQILFALFTAHLLAILAAHQFAPAPGSWVAWATPMLLGSAFYALAINSASPPGANAWVNVLTYAQALPVDWLTAGAGGGVLGYWISERIHEMRHFEGLEKEKATS